MADEVVVLRNFRDKVMSTNVLGRRLVKLYYNVSPPMANFVAEHESLRSAARWVLLPLVGISWLTLKLGSEAILVLLLSVLVLIGATSSLLYRKIRLQK